MIDVLFSTSLYSVHNPLCSVPTTFYCTVTVLPVYNFYTDEDVDGSIEAVSLVVERIQLTNTTLLKYGLSAIFLLFFLVYFLVHKGINKTFAK